MTLIEEIRTELTEAALPSLSPDQESVIVRVCDRAAAVLEDQINRLEDELVARSV